ncbi:Crp/Fnr family transcriptional regulator [Sphingomonas aracearum]|uniref:Crp/Fnr family transcriptional regulator n=1 Tax=Sphingomonas aracearum TaxID=2283317 RepID=UPI001EF11DFE|nr:Crp/Fnr family transcriptional regulator [Sphingomonas aracearum]
MQGSCLAGRLNALAVLTNGEQAALARIEERTRTLRRGATLQREHDAVAECYIACRGTLMSSVLLDDGSRQILAFLYPGDLVAFPNLVYRAAPETVSALTDAVVAPLDRPTFAGLLQDHPRLVALMLASQQIERVELTDRLAAVGRTSAKARVGALLLEIRNRLRVLDGTGVKSFSLGLTQEEIGDATGLTAVHVNRMLRQLEEEGMIAREAGRLTILDERALQRAANYSDRRAGLELDWLPQGR